MNKLNIIMQKFSFHNRTILGKTCGILTIAWCTRIFFQSFPNPLNRPDLFFIFCTFLGFLIFTFEKK